jgi:hypothetical protein
MTMISPEFAVYLPAVNDSYAKELTKTLDPTRPFPSGLTLDDLVFWDKNNKLWQHREILHSIGLHKFNTIPDNAVTRMGRTDCLLLGDSAGFQIGKGTIKGYDKLREGMASANAIEAWQAAYDLRMWILSYLETHCTYAMTIDMPLWARLSSNSSSPFHTCSIAELTAMTVENLRFIDAHRQGRTKWLNVVQGLDEQTTKDWWTAVSWFDCGGYALAGAAGARGGIKQVLQTVLMMRDGGALAEWHDWIHVLGVSTPLWAILLTALQQSLRKSVNPKIRFSYDSSSPFKTAGMNEQVAVSPVYGRGTGSWSFKYDRAPQSTQFAGSTEPFPYSSPLGDQLTLGHLSVRGGEWDHRSFDTISNLLLVNHNVWVFLDAFERANQIAFNSDRSSMPAHWATCIDFIGEIFNASDWQAELLRETRLLDSVAANEY